MRNRHSRSGILTGNRHHNRRETKKSPEYIFVFFTDPYFCLPAPIPLMAPKPASLAHSPTPKLRPSLTRPWYHHRFFCLLIISVSWALSFSFACDLPADLRDNRELLPERVQHRFCHPDEGFRSLLLIRTAVNKDAPVYRIIAVKHGHEGTAHAVRLFQFDRHGNDHQPVSGENQAVIDFHRDGIFEARVKGKKTTVSFAERSFEFVMHGLFGLRINQPLDATGMITAAGKPTNVLLIQTPDKDEWQWVFMDGKRAPF